MDILRANDSELPLRITGIKKILARAVSLFSMLKHIEKEASRIANLLIKKHGKELTMQNSIKYFETIDIESVENDDVKSIGAKHLAHETAKKLKVPEILAQTGFNQKNYFIVSTNYRSLTVSWK